MGGGVGETVGAGRRAACLDVIQGLSWETVLEEVRMEDLTAILGGTNIIDTLQHSFVKCDKYEVTLTLEIFKALFDKNFTVLYTII